MASSPYPKMTMGDGIVHDKSKTGSVGPSLARSDKPMRRVTGRPPEPAVDPQMSPLSRGISRARGGMRPKQPSVGYSHAS